jgi:hypothetical protein
MSEPPSRQPFLSQCTPFCFGPDHQTVGFAEAASVPRKPLDRHGELRTEAEAIVSGMLAEISLFSVADDSGIGLRWR